MTDNAFAAAVIILAVVVFIVFTVEACMMAKEHEEAEFWNRVWKNTEKRIKKRKELEKRTNGKDKEAGKP